MHQARGGHNSFKYIRIILKHFAKYPRLLTALSQFVLYHPVQPSRSRTKHGCTNGPYHSTQPRVCFRLYDLLHLLVVVVAFQQNLHDLLT